MFTVRTNNLTHINKLLNHQIKLKFIMLGLTRKRIIIHLRMMFIHYHKKKKQQQRKCKLLVINGSQCLLFGTLIHVG